MEVIAALMEQMALMSQVKSVTQLASVGSGYDVIQPNVAHWAGFCRTHGGPTWGGRRYIPLSAWNVRIWVRIHAG